MKYEVNIIYKGQVNYIVEADNEQEAEELAWERHTDGDKSDELGTEWEEADNIIVKPIQED